MDAGTITRCASSSRCGTHAQSGSTRSSLATSSIQSKRSTQTSFASSRTSYCTSVDTTDSSKPCPLPTCSATPERAFDEASGSRRNTSGAGQTGPSSAKTFGSSKLKKAAQGVVQACCPWCAKTFTRRHDFRKHAHEFHLGRVVWQCRNPRCNDRMRSERDAKQHGNCMKSVDCKNFGTARISLLCDKMHFGCPHCARYFSDATAYIDHLSFECCPDKAPRSAHQSLQVRALLQ